MKKIIASVVFAALGASTLHAQFSPGPSPANPRGWSVSLSVREFYDDNYLTVNNNAPGSHSSYGEEVSPSLSLNTTFNDSTLSLSYVYDMLYYDTSDTMDSSHQFKAGFIQRFSDRYSLQVNEAFTVFQQPTVDSQGLTSEPLYASGNNINNNASIGFTAGLTPMLDLQLSYDNDLWAFQQTFGDVVNPNDANAPGLNPSRSALLDRMDQLATINLDWKMIKELTWVLGYTYGHTGYTSPEPIIFYAPGGNPLNESLSNPKNIYSQSRNSDSHFFFVGVDRELTSQLTGRIRAGGEYLDYYNADSSTLSPYVEASLTWAYMKDSTLQGGVTHEHSATDVVGAEPTAGGQPVLDAESTAAYLSLNQKIAGGLSGGLMGQFQHSAFNGGTLNGQSEDLFITGLNIAYHFSPYLSAEAGYNWNKLVSDVSARDYTRNIVYIGVRATY